MKDPIVRIVLIVTAAVATAALLPIVVASRDGGAARPREITIVAKNMTFYVNGETSPNPILRLKAGEHVRLVLRNEDPGMTHDFVVKDWNVATKTLAAKGEQDAVVFRVPEQRGVAGYQCTPHSEMMRGRIQVE